MIVCVPLTEDGLIGGGWGRAARVAVAGIEDGRVASWDEHAVGWDALRDTGTEGGHHARIARFLQAQAVDLVLAGHMGPPMRQMLERMGVDVRVGVSGDARAAVSALAAGNG